MGSYHIHDHSVRVAVRHHASKRAPPSHTEAARVVDEDEVRSTFLETFCREANAYVGAISYVSSLLAANVLNASQLTSSSTNEDLATLQALLQSLQDLCSRRGHRHSSKSPGEMQEKSEGRDTA